MIWRRLLVAALVALLLPAAASAKGVTKFLVVGANGRTVNLGSGWSVYADLRPQQPTPAPRPEGKYLLLYPLMEEEIPMQPGRYYPRAAVACWSWSRSIGDCYRTGRLPKSWGRTKALTPFVSGQTGLRRLEHQGMRYRVPSNDSVAIELALLQTRATRRAPSSRCWWRLRARWQGPAAASRPTSLCLRVNGVSTGGRLYPMPRDVAAMLHTVT